MTSPRELLFNLLVNATVQIAIFAIAAAIVAPLIAKARPKHQHLFHLAVLALCFTAPAINTLWHPAALPRATQAITPALSGSSSVTTSLWSWSGHFAPAHLQPHLIARIETTLLSLWFALILYKLVRFTHALRRIAQLRRQAQPLETANLETAHSTIARQKFALLQSEQVPYPVTLGVFRPAIILPSSLIPMLQPHELSAIVAHEHAHICRRDFLIHLLCEALSIPVALHPGIRYLMSKVAQTRELACDEIAASQLGKPRFYARTLLRLASLCLHVPAGSAVALGVFDGDNLEERIVMLTTRKTPMSRTRLAALALVATLTLSSGAVLARATSRVASGDAVQPFVGTWHWMFHGKSFATMTLTRSGSALTGTVTESRIALADDGSLSKADPTPDADPSQISEAVLDGTTLRIKTSDNFAFTVTLDDKNHAAIKPIGAPSNMKPISAEKSE